MTDDFTARERLISEVAYPWNKRIERWLERFEECGCTDEDQEVREVNGTLVSICEPCDDCVKCEQAISRLRAHKDIAIAEAKKAHDVIQSMRKFG